MSNSAVSVALVGTRSVEELEDNLAAMEWVLSGKDLADIDEVFARYGLDTQPDMVIDPDE